MAAPLKHGYMYREVGVAGSDCALGVRDSLKPPGTPWHVRERGEGAPLAFLGEGSRGPLLSGIPIPGTV